MVILTLIGRHPGGNLVIYTYDKKGACKEIILLGEDTQFQKVGDSVTIRSGNRSVVVGADSLISQGLNIWWKEKESIGKKLNDIIEEGIVYNSELRPKKEECQ